MAEFRLYFLNADGHIAARLEFAASNDAAALAVAANIAEQSTDVHSGYMLWQGARLVYSTERGEAVNCGSRIDPRILSRGALGAERQKQIVELEEQLLSSHWCLARSRRLLEATARLREAQAWSESVEADRHAHAL